MDKTPESAKTFLDEPKDMGGDKITLADKAGQTSSNKPFKSKLLAWLSCVKKQ